MKKVIVASVALFFAAISNVNAGTTTDTPIEITSGVQQDSTEKRTPVMPSDLPAAVQQVFTGDDYKGWTPSSAFLVNNKDKEYYEVKLTKEGGEANIVKLDKDGKKAE